MPFVLPLAESWLMRKCSLPYIEPTESCSEHYCYAVKVVMCIWTKLQAGCTSRLGNDVETVSDPDRSSASMAPTERFSTRHGLPSQLVFGWSDTDSVDCAG